MFRHRSCGALRLGVFVSWLAKEGICHAIFCRLRPSEIGQDDGRFWRPPVPSGDRNLHRSGLCSASGRYERDFGSLRGHLYVRGSAACHRRGVPRVWRGDSEIGFRQQLPRLYRVARQPLAFVTDAAFKSPLAVRPRLLRLRRGVVATDHPVCVPRHRALRETRAR